jgi:type II secretory pathway predicted ATPase ExeA
LLHTIENTSASSLSAAAIQARLDKFDDIFITHPRLLALRGEMDTLMSQTQSRVAKNEKRRIAAGNRPIKPDELWLLPVIGPSGSGKSFSTSSIVDSLYADPDLPPDEIPVLAVTLRSSSRSPRHVQAQILEAFDSPEAAAVLRGRDYSEAYANDSIRKIARLKKTHLVILDEAHNLLANGISLAPKMAKAFKSLVNDGIFSLVLCGTEEVMPLLNCDGELQSRQKEVLDFGRFRLNAEDLSYFLNFVALLESEMMTKGVVDAPIGLTMNADACATVYDMSEGVIGIVARIMRLALERAMKAGSTTVTWEDVGNAYRSWQVIKKSLAGTDGKSVNKRDPFLKGPDKRTIDAVNRKLKTDNQAKA